MMNTGILLYFGITTGRRTSGRKDHVIAFLADALESVQFKDADQDLIGDRANLRHAGLKVGL